MSKRRKAPRRSPIPRLPEQPRLLGWSLDQLADEIGADRVQLLQLLRDRMRAGEVARIEVGDQVLWARVGGGAVTEVQR